MTKIAHLFGLQLITGFFVFTPMTIETIEINDFTILIEQSDADKMVIEKCDLGDQVVGFVFFESGNVALEISYGQKTSSFNNSTGLVTSFYGTADVVFTHKISPDKPLKSIAIFTTIENLRHLTKQENGTFPKHLKPLIDPKDDFVEGPNYYMTPDMQNAVHKILNTSYTGATKRMFLESQVMELLAHFFGLVSNIDQEGNGIKTQEKEQLNRARKILLERLDNPPSLNELSKLIGLNNYKLKKNFKILFGMPVYKYLQNERLNKAHQLLRNKDMSIQEAAWFVGYESLSSFSNAFLQKFGFRPSEIKK